MGAFNITYNAIFRTFAILGVILFIYFFPDILTWVFIAFILMLIGRPITNAICNIRIFKRPVHRSIAAAITILLFLLVLLLSLFFFVPSLIKELQVFQNLDYDKLIASITLFVNNLQLFLYDKNIIEPDQSLIGMFVNEALQFINLGSIPSVLGNFINSASSFLFAIFSVFFITFFFIKDDMRPENFLRVFFAERYVGRLTQVVDNVNHLLTRYFTGMVVKTIIMAVMLYLGFLLFGIKGALLMALIGAITNIIPYLGPFIGWGIVLLFGMTNSIGTEMYSEILPMIIKVSVIFIGANALENLVLGPLIYSQSIKAHPVEVFLVTILGGRIAGMAGMILGIPAYTIIRTAVIEIYNYMSEKDAKTE